jgi:hypothetical protein
MTNGTNNPVTYPNPPASPQRTLTASAQLGPNDAYVFGDTSAGALTATLPALSSIPAGRPITIEALGAELVTLAAFPSDGNAIEGIAASVLLADREALTVVRSSTPTTTFWRVVSRSAAGTTALSGVVTVDSVNGNDSQGGIANGVPFRTMQAAVDAIVQDNATAGPRAGYTLTPAPWQQFDEDLSIDVSNALHLSLVADGGWMLGDFSAPIWRPVAGRDLLLVGDASPVDGIRPSLSIQTAAWASWKSSLWRVKYLVRVALWRSMRAPRS